MHTGMNNKLAQNYLLTEFFLINKSCDEEKNPDIPTLIWSIRLKYTDKPGCKF